MEADNVEEHRKNREGKTTEERLMQLEKPVLVDRIRKLEIHVQQLQNLLQAKDKPQTARPVKPFDFSRFKRRHVALRLLYLGWDYSGYVLQEDTGRTVEAALFEALERTRLLEDRADAHYHRCGRTDKGVSAFSQVISIDLRTNLTEGIGVFAQEGYQPNTSAGEASSGCCSTAGILHSSPGRGTGLRQDPQRRPATRNSRAGLGPRRPSLQCAFRLSPADLPVFLPSR